MSHVDPYQASQPTAEQGDDALAPAEGILLALEFMVAVILCAVLTFLVIS